MKANMKKKLDEMVDKPFMINGKNETVKTWSFDGETIFIHTDKQQHQVLFTDFHYTMQKDFLPVEEDPKSEETSPNIPAKITQEIQLTVDNKVASELKDILMSNIEKVKSNPKFIPQAQEINNNVKTIIDLAKTEVDMLKVKVDLLKLQKSQL